MRLILTNPIWKGSGGPSRVGATLAESQVTIAIVALLITLLLPAARRTREHAAGVRCRHNRKQLMLALHNFESNDRRSDYLSTAKPLLLSEGED
jgi:hypothetical protein